MSVDNETVRQIAYLARLGVEPEKLEETQIEFNKILSWVEELGEVDTTDGNQSKAVLSNAPQKEFGYFAVPKVVE